MSYKQRALALAETLGAESTESWYDDMMEVWIVDFVAPKSKRWAFNGEHCSWQRERTLTECWRDFIRFAEFGLEDCPLTCDCYVEAEPVSEDEQARRNEREEQRQQLFDAAVAFVIKQNASYVKPTRAELLEARKGLEAKAKMRRIARAGAKL